MSKGGKSFFLVLTVVIALVLLGSVVFSQVGDARYHLEGYSRGKAEWVRGNLKGWLEDNWVPYRLRMEIVTSGSFDVTIQHDYEWTGSGGPDPGVDMCRSEHDDPFYGTPEFWTEPTYDDFWIGDEAGVLLPISVSTARISDLIESNTILIQYTSTFTVPSEYVGEVIYLYWMAHLAIGSSGWSGSSLHAHTAVTGNQDVPIAIPPHNEIYGHKFYDYNRNGIVPDDGDYGIGGWKIFLEGIYLEGPISWETQTDDAGYYEFLGLPDGTWTITEELRSAEGWMQTTVSTYTVSVHGGQIEGPYDFGNYLLEPAIDVEKSGPGLAHEGDTIKYTITVSNTGNGPLSDVTLTDTVLGIIDGTFSLAVGETKAFYVDYIVPAGVEWVNNTVTAEGYDELGRQVTDTDDWSVRIIHPQIDVQKSGVDLAHEGDTITYTITVRNTGDCPLYGVTVIDTLLGDLTSYLPDDTLDLGEVNTFDVDYTVPVCEGTPAKIDNTVTASGTDKLGLTVSDVASWSVDVILPYPPVAKFTEDPVEPLVGQTVTFNASISQPGFDGYDVCPITEYRWDFDGDGELDLVSNKSVVTFIFDAEGEYNVTLTVYAPPGPQGLPCYDPYDTMWHIKTVVPPVGRGYAVPIGNEESSSLNFNVGLAYAIMVAFFVAFVWTRRKSGKMIRTLKTI
ncbi:MAG: PKD domain-containing protein [Candidatus Bathyarchaeota archaeon]|nr:PKD domain-containing protein [Candidatus Bathyarchaeota archaeon]